MSGHFPHILGKTLGLIENLVNSDGNKGEDVFLESVDNILRIEDVQRDVGDGVHANERACQVLIGGVEEQLDPGYGAIGPAHLNNFSNTVGEGGCAEGSGINYGPKILKTRSGDILFKRSTDEVSGEVQSANLQLEMGIETLEKDELQQNTNIYRRQSNKKAVPNLPATKMRKYAGTYQKTKRAARRKKLEQRNQQFSSSRQHEGSDSISDVAPLVQIGQPQPVFVDAPEGFLDVSDEFLLEVVLPDINGAIEEGNAGNSLCHNRSSSIADEIPSRKILEAQKILSIQKDLGITVQGNRDDYVRRIVDLEARDQQEMQGWELNRDIIGSQ
ncbi:hypothetical protein P8452_46522 [Trifolium repens]|nr:hypothetical protein P8452_46522 [Trifolium repens]